MDGLKKIIYVHLFFIFLAVPNTYAQHIEYRTLPGSKMWIDGTSTLNNYTCETKDVDGIAEVYNSSSLSGKSPEKNRAFLTVMVQSLNCGLAMMNTDMFNAMKYKKYPFIRYELIKASVVTNVDSAGGWYKIKTEGNLTIAGKTNKVVIMMKVRKMKDNVYRLVGSKLLTMKEFGITPPSHFWGLIRAHQGLTVHFDLLAAKTSGNNFETNKSSAE